jgi:hypothetical protein
MSLKSINNKWMIFVAETRFLWGTDRMCKNYFDVFGPQRVTSVTVPTRSVIFRRDGSHLGKSRILSSLHNGRCVRDVADLSQITSRILRSCNRSETWLACGQTCSGLTGIDDRRDRVTKRRDCFCRFALLTDTKYFFPVWMKYFIDC